MTRHFGKICAKHPELEGERLNSNSRCVACKNEKVHEYMRRKYLNDPEWKKRHLGRLARSRRKVGKGALYMAERRAAIDNRIPPWADAGKIEKMYGKARSLGITVDHFYPLRGETVSGLHIHTNMRLIPQPENDSKGNRHPEEFYHNYSQLVRRLPK